MMGMNAEEIRVSRKIIRGLEFDIRSDLIGRSFEAFGFDDLVASDALLGFIGFEGSLVNTRRQLELTLLKYDFVELTYQLTRWESPAPSGRSPQWRELVADPSLGEVAETPEQREGRLEFLKDLCREIDSGSGS